MGATRPPAPDLFTALGFTREDAPAPEPAAASPASSRPTPRRGADAEPPSVPATEPPAPPDLCDGVVFDEFGSDDLPTLFHRSPFHTDTAPESATETPYRGLADVLEPPAPQPVPSPRGPTPLLASTAVPAPMPATVTEAIPAGAPLWAGDELPAFMGGSQAVTHRPSGPRPPPAWSPPLRPLAPPPADVVAAVSRPQSTPPPAVTPVPMSPSAWVAMAGVAPAPAPPAVKDVAVAEAAGEGDRDASRPDRGVSPWPWIALSVMLTGALGYILFTRTDLFRGDDPAVSGDAEPTAPGADPPAGADAKPGAEGSLATEQGRSRGAEFGTLALNSSPDGARVWWVRSGPEANFRELPLGNAYMVAVMAPGHWPRVRVVKPSELGTPIVMDLEPLPAEATDEPEMPAADPPELAERPATQTATLTLRSNTPGASLALLVGYTPGVSVADLDVSETHRFLVTLPDHESHEIEVRAPSWEQTEAGPTYQETVELAPSGT